MSIFDKYLGPQVDNDGGPGPHKTIKLIRLVILVIMREINILRQEINTINANDNLADRTVDQLKNQIEQELDL